ncbi:MAG: sel1 repeat family protein [Deltaproteobacteria bacterium]|jgi:hypothetical protein|nr:sel1 repeat family protein [Deltaproteobacteria bacterium]
MQQLLTLFSLFDEAKAGKADAQLELGKEFARINREKSALLTKNEYIELLIGKLLASNNDNAPASDFMTEGTQNVSELVPNGYAQKILSFLGMDEDMDSGSGEEKDDDDNGDDGDDDDDELEINVQTGSTENADATPGLPVKSESTDQTMENFKYVYNPPVCSDLHIDAIRIIEEQLRRNTSNTPKYDEDSELETLMKLSEIKFRNMTAKVAKKALGRQFLFHVKLNLLPEYEPLFPINSCYLLLNSVHWWRKAAEQGLPEAQFLLGSAYADGQGVAKDKERAAFWWSKAAGNGLLIAQLMFDDLISEEEGME